MATRTFKQSGQGFGSGTCTITAKIDGVVVYSGPVPTVAGSAPGGPTGENDEYPVLFTWTTDTEFEGTKTMEISVSGTALYLAEVKANHYAKPVPQPGLDPENFANWQPIWETSGPDDFDVFFKQDVGIITFTDSISDAEINGISVQKSRDPDFPGQIR